MAVSVLTRKKFFGSRRRPVTIHRVPQQAAAMRHRHEFCEIVVILSGSGVHVTGDFRREIGAGDVLFINSRRAHGYERPRSLNLVNILVHDRVMARLARQLKAVRGCGRVRLFDTKAARWARPTEEDGLRLGAAELAQVEAWMNALEAESRGEGRGARRAERKAKGGASGARGTEATDGEGGAVAEAYLMLIMATVARSRGVAVKGNRAGAAGAGMGAAGVGGVVSWLEKNLGREIKVEELARQAGMSERSFYRAFRETMGCTPVDYVLRMRLRRAEAMLKEPAGRKRVSEIAEACGFADSNYFSVRFRRWKGCSPSAWRAGE